MVNQQQKIYLAAPLFSECERSFNAFLKQKLTRLYEVYLPQEDGLLLVDLVKGGSELSFASKLVFNRDIQEVQSCDILLLVMDGRSIDEGACFELGLAYSLGKRCIGLQTDSRRLLPIGNNPMIENSLSKTFHSVEELLGELAPPVDTMNDVEHECASPSSSRQPSPHRVHHAAYG